MHIKEHVCGYTKDSFCDCPGYLAPVLFVGGCNLRCPTCHNAAFSYLDPVNYPRVEWSQVEADIQSKADWYGAIVVSGGEVTTVSDVVPKLAALKAEFGLPLKVDTNGLRPDLIRTLLEEGIASWVAVDVKHTWHRYSTVTGVPLSREFVENCFEQIFDLAFRHYGKVTFRTTLVPEISELHRTMIRDQVPPDFELTFQQYIERN